MKVDLNQVITELSIVLSKDLPLTNIIKKYGNETIGEAMQFIKYEQREQIEMEENYEQITRYLVG